MNATLHGDFRPDPVRAHARQPDRLGERRFRDFHRVEPRPQLHQQFRIKTGADLAGEHELSLVVMADQQRAESDASALGIGEAADHELPRRLALHLDPRLRPALLVAGIAALGDDPFPALRGRALPRLRIVQRLDALHRVRATAAPGAVPGARGAAAASGRVRRAT